MTPAQEQALGVFFSFLKRDVWCEHSYSLDEEGILLVDGRRKGGVRLKEVLFTLDGGVATSEAGIARIADSFIEDINRAEFEGAVWYFAGLVDMVWPGVPFSFYIQQESPTEILLVIARSDLSERSFTIEARRLCVTMREWLHDDIAAELLLLA